MTMNEIMKCKWNGKATMPYEGSAAAPRGDIPKP